MLCFGFVIRRALITRQCSDSCWAVLAQCQGSLFPTQHPPVSRLGISKRLGGTQLGQLTPTDQKDIPCLMISCLAITLKVLSSKLTVAPRLGIGLFARALALSNAMFYCARQRAWFAETISSQAGPQSGNSGLLQCGRTLGVRSCCGLSWI